MQVETYTHVVRQPQWYSWFPKTSCSVTYTVELFTYQMRYATAVETSLYNFKSSSQIRGYPSNLFFHFTYHLNIVQNTHVRIVEQSFNPAVEYKKSMFYGFFLGFGDFWSILLPKSSVTYKEGTIHWRCFCSRRSTSTAYEGKKFVYQRFLFWLFRQQWREQQRQRQRQQ